MKKLLAATILATAIAGSSFAAVQVGEKADAPKVEAKTEAKVEKKMEHKKSTSMHKGAKHAGKKAAKKAASTGENPAAIQ